MILEAYNYVFGAEHSKGSFARDMMSGESIGDRKV